jgi:hypothetical protein
MKAKIYNFRGLVSLEAEWNGILLVGGNNEAGKTSACAAIAAAASGNMLPFEGVKKGSAGLLVHDGEDLAIASVTVGDGQASVRWPEVERTIIGPFRDASSMAVGLESLTAMKAEERAARLQQVIKAEPTKEQLSKALKEVPGVTNDMVEAIWQKTRIGWDTAHAFYKEDGARAKGRWEKTTGQRFGLTKATWRPEGWDVGLEARGIEDLERDLAEAQEALTRAQTSAGVDEAVRGRLEAECANLSALNKALRDAGAEFERCKGVFDAADTKWRAMGQRPAEAQKPLVCPRCSELLMLRDGALVPFVGDSAGLIAEKIARWDAAKLAVETAHRDAGTADRAVQAAAADQAKAQKAADDLNRMPATGGEQAYADATAAQERAKAADVALRMKRAVVAAATEFADIKRLIKVVDILAADGIRKDILIGKIADFNKRLVDLAAVADWRPVHIDADMSVSYGGRPFGLCAESGQYRAEVVLQVAIALEEGAPLVVIDGADILDRDGRDGLVGMLIEAGIPAVIGMTLMERAQMPDLAKAELGASVWIDQGKGS